MVVSIITHRTSASYARFVKGTVHSQEFQRHVLNTGSLMFAYAHASKAAVELTDAYLSTWVRLLSLFHAVGISKLQSRRARPVPLGVIDLDGLDAGTVKTFWEEAELRPELVIQWIQASAVQAIGDGVLVIGPPIAAQIWVQLCMAYDGYMQALRLVEVPFPFPYVQLAEIILFVHCFLTPIVLVGLTEEPVWCGVFSILISWLMLSLNKIAANITDPYGHSHDSLDMDIMQEDLNKKLLLLSRPSTREVPTLNLWAKDVCVEKAIPGDVLSYVLLGKDPGALEGENKN